MGATKNPDPSRYVSRLLFEGKRPIARGEVIKTLGAAAQAIAKAKAKAKKRLIVEDQSSAKKAATS